jgi:hypothetical protein
MQALKQVNLLNLLGGGAVLLFRTDCPVAVPDFFASIFAISPKKPDASPDCRVPSQAGAQTYEKRATGLVNLPDCFAAEHAR